MTRAGCPAKSKVASCRPAPASASVMTIVRSGPSDQFSIHFMCPSQCGKRARSAMEQGSHGIETVGDMRDAQFYGFLRLLIRCIGMTHTDGDASIYQTANHCRGSRQLRGER